MCLQNIRILLLITFYHCHLLTLRNLLLIFYINILDLCYTNFNKQDRNRIENIKSKLCAFDTAKLIGLQPIKFVF